MTAADKKKELGKLLESIAVSGSTFESLDLSEKIIKITEELAEDSGLIQPNPEEPQGRG